MGLTNPWVLLGLLVAILSAALGGFFYGGKVTEDRLVAQWETEKNKAITAAVAEANTQSRKDYETNLASATKILAAELARKVRQGEVTHEVTNNVIYRSADCVLPVSGLRLLTEALAGHKGRPVPPSGAHDETTGRAATPH